MTLLLRTVTYNRAFAALGGVNCAVYLSHLMYNADRLSDDDGYFPANVDAIQKVTGLSPNEQMLARVQLRGLGVISDQQTAGEPLIKIDEVKLSTSLEGAKS